ncbi:hypothetical protein [Xenorhabdus sp. NBAII XenSa04]|nr:hypothetical protein [Xenorhabdus sp. NBAII XenSa04]
MKIKMPPTHVRWVRDGNGAAWVISVAIQGMDTKILGLVSSGN